jgi:hypothetical protein
MRFVLLSLVVLGVGGCAKHGVDAVKEMRARACAADAAGFVAHIDRGAITRQIVGGAQKKAEASFAELDPAAQAAARERFRKWADSGSAVNDTFEVWEGDIKRGPASDFCHMSILESSEVGDTATVHVIIPNGGEWRWKMARNGDRWLLAGTE